MAVIPTEVVIYTALQEKREGLVMMYRHIGMTLFTMVDGLLASLQLSRSRSKTEQQSLYGALVNMQRS
jgi:hypothetical protein